MITSNAYNYINVLDKAADASWTRESVLAQNIANVDTPGYKRKDLDFESQLQQQLKHYKYTNLDEKVKKTDLSKLKANIYTDLSNYSYRLDGNKVDIDTENFELASEQIKYEALTNSINAEFTRMRQAMGKA